jgi:uncharacterized membrane protein YphA (DoxX/SURF4 family)
MAAVGRVALGLGAAGLGAISLVHADFAITWQPVPEWVPARGILAYLSGALLLGAGAALILNVFTRTAAAVLAAFIASWALVLHPFKYAEGAQVLWLATAEALAVAAGALLLTGAAWAERVGRYLFGVCTPIFGIAHFLYIDFTASMVPAWIPVAVFWAWATGAGHVAGGASILTGILARAGSTALALMMTSFVLLVHVPRVAADPSLRVEWHLLSTATLLTGAAWVVASFFARPKQAN